MTEFQLSLVAAGGVFVLGVVTYNKWQEYKARKSVERAFAADHDDVLMRGGAGPLSRQEPVLAEPTRPETGFGYLAVAGEVVDITRYSPAWAWAAGGIVSTAEDLNRFYAALLTGGLLFEAV